MNTEAKTISPTNLPAGSAENPLADVRANAVSAIRAANDRNELEQIKIQYLGKKGELTNQMKNLATLPPEQRKEFGAALNTIKLEVESEFEERKGLLEREALFTRLEKEWIDCTLPVECPVATTQLGSIHPITQVQRDLETIFRGFGFSVVDGPEVEFEHYNFDALNVPSSHPARDMQDTIWTKDGNLLRTHTSPMQVRTMEKMQPPSRVLIPGRVFRYERVDATHGHTFYQMEGMMIDRHVTIGHLIYFMKTLLREIFGSEQKVRLRPGFFPFVEPGFELDIWFNDRWLELLPCGLVHPKVLEAGGVNPKEWQGFAFGLGLSRLTMSRYKIEDIRHLDGADLRVLRQFS